MTKHELQITLEQADCMLAKTNVSDDYRREMRAVKMHCELEIEKLDLIEFNEHLKQFLSKLDDTSDEAHEKFAKIPWTITVDGKTLTISNCAAIYNGIESAVTEMLSDYGL